jgi:hypothetical protein
MQKSPSFDSRSIAMNSQRRELLDLLAVLSDQYPEMRLGQVLTWFAGAARGQRVESIYDAEDEELIAAMRNHLAKKMTDAKRQTVAG